MQAIRFFGLGFAGLMLVGVGCAAPAGRDDSDARRKMLAMLMPSRIEIVEPFTRIMSFDENATPDGIELLVQAINSLDNPGQNVVGGIRAELYEFVPASADPKGRRLEHWTVELTTPEQQRTYWNALTQMYEFRLELDSTKIPPADQYVLVVSYHSPLGEHLHDQCIIGYRRPAGSFDRRTKGRR